MPELHLGELIDNVQFLRGFYTLSPRTNSQIFAVFTGEWLEWLVEKDLLITYYSVALKSSLLLGSIV